MSGPVQQGSALTRTLLDGISTLSTHLPTLNDDPKFPSWLKDIVHSLNGPSVAFVFCNIGQDSGKGLERARCVALNYHRQTLAHSDDLPLQYLFPSTYSQRQINEGSLQLVEAKDNQTHSVSDASEATVPAPKIFDLPTELFTKITKNLSHCDVKNMRLVCKQFEYHTSSYFFNTVVVPFTKEFFNSIVVRTPELTTRTAVHGKAVPQDSTSQDSSYRPDTDIFRDFGDDIIQFGMSFDVSEDQLAAVPNMSDLIECEAFWGTYKWPNPDPRRFPDLAGLEALADQTALMRAAFSKMTNVKKIALSIDCGLGWINGEDLSLRARVIRQKSAVFGGYNFTTAAEVQAQRDLWTLIESTYLEAGFREVLKFSSLRRLEHDEMDYLVMALEDSTWSTMPQQLLDGLSKLHAFKPFPPLASDILAVPSFSDNAPTEGNTANPRVGYDAFVDQQHSELATSYEAERSHSSMQNSSESPSSPCCNPRIGGFLITAREASQSLPVLLPNDLSQSQKDWLLETSWAQDAFLTTYINAIIDNQLTFQNVQTLKLSHFSSRFLAIVNKETFWTAMPTLKELDILVIPDWRKLEMRFDGHAELAACDPSVASSRLYELLAMSISGKSSIKFLTIGWIGGGEHAEGVGARNQLVMPAPIVPLFYLLSKEDIVQHVLRLPHVVSLTLVNCWCTPNALETFVSNHEECALTNLTLESFSLSMHPKFAQHPRNRVYPRVQAWSSHLREGSWAATLYHLEGFFGGYDFEKEVFLQPPCPSDVKRREFNLALLSCGYVRVPNIVFDERAINSSCTLPDPFTENNPEFKKRRKYARETLLSTEDKFLGNIVERLPFFETVLIKNTYNHLHPGWPLPEDHLAPYDDDDGWGKWGEKTKTAAEFDLFRPGGSGRFSGKFLDFGSLFGVPAAFVVEGVEGVFEKRPPNEELRHLLRCSAH